MHQITKDLAEGCKQVFYMYNVCSDQQQIGNIIFPYQSNPPSGEFDFLLMEFGEQVLMRTSSTVNQGQGLFKTAALVSGNGVF